MAMAQAAAPPSGILLSAIQEADAVQRVMCRDADQFRYIDDDERDMPNIYSEAELRGAHTVIQTLALLGAMENIDALPPDSFTDLIIVILDSRWAGHGHVTDDLEEAGFGFADSLAIYQLQPLALPNAQPIWDLQLIENQLYADQPGGPRPLAPPRLWLTQDQLRRVRVAHANIRLALPAVIFPHDARFVDIDSDRRPIMSDIVRPLGFHPVPPVYVPPAEGGPQQAANAHLPAAPGVSQEMILRAQSKDFINNADRVDHLQGIMSRVNFVNFVGDMSQDIPVWANVVGRLRVEVAQVLGPKQLLTDAQANQVLGLKFGSSSGKALPTHLSWTFWRPLARR
jgi:hypothetical protein